MNLEEQEFELAIIDADSILYQIAYVQPSPALCKKEFDRKLNQIMEATEAQHGAVFIKGVDNFRYNVAVDYKGNRKDTIEPEVKDRIDMLYEYAKDFCIESDGAEADDYCGVASQLATNDKQSHVICHIDKDLDMIPGWHYNFKKSEFYYIDQETGYINLMKQILTGDNTDNIQGIKGLGPKTAEKLLNGTLYSNALDIVIDTYKKKCGDQWEHAFCKAANLIYIRMTAEDFRQLSFEELKQKFKWSKNGNEESANTVDVPRETVSES